MHPLVRRAGPFMILKSTKLVKAEKKRFWRSIFSHGCTLVHLWEKVSSSTLGRFNRMECYPMHHPIISDKRDGQYIRWSCLFLHGRLLQGSSGVFVDGLRPKCGNVMQSGNQLCPFGHIHTMTGSCLSHSSFTHGFSVGRAIIGSLVNRCIPMLHKTLFFSFWMQLISSKDSILLSNTR